MGRESPFGRAAAYSSSWWALSNDGEYSEADRPSRFSAPSKAGFPASGTCEQRIHTIAQPKTSLWQVDHPAQELHQIRRSLAQPKPETVATAAMFPGPLKVYVANFRSGSDG